MGHLPSSRLAAACVFVTGMMAGGASRADAPTYKPQPLRLEKRNPAAQNQIDAGRARMKAGDCKAALDAFDTALRYVVDPTVVRDRGICGEKLGFVYPAIDDYRVYLTQRPDAPDADAIRERLDRLEGGGSSTPNDDVPDAPAASKGAAKDADGSDAGADAAEGSGNRDQLEEVTRDEVAQNSSLRAGKGFSLYPFFAVHKLVLSPNPPANGDPTWSESVGVGLRYSLDARGTLLVEAGYQRFNPTDANPSAASGLTSLIAYEFRFPLKRSYDDQLFLTLGVGYEHAGIPAADATGSGRSEGAIFPRVRFGYRRLLGHATALDVSVDGGVSKLFQYSSSQLMPPDDPTVYLFAANVALVWGL